MDLIIVLATLAIAIGLGYVALKVPLKAPFKIGVIVLAVLSLLFGIKHAMQSGVIPTPQGMKAMIPEKTSVSLAGDVVAGAPTATYELAAQPATNMQGCQRLLSIPWNGAASLTLANGGAQTTKDSYVQKYAGGCLKIERQDDYGVMKQELLKFAEGVKNGEANPQGAAFVVIMGDGYPAFVAGLAPQLEKYGQKIAVVGVNGFSYGEDKCMGKPLNGNPANAKGSLISAVPYDGDWNICVKFASDNGIKVNVDQTTYDPDAINFVDTSSFVEADDKYITSACETRKVVKDGVRTDENRKVCVDGVATWTPGDTAVVKQKGGLTTWASTKEYNQQMPSIIIGNAEWMAKHRDYVVGLLRAVDRGAFQIRSTEGGLAAMGKTQAAVFGTGGGEEASPEFWSKHYVGFDINDGQGNTVNVGGSRAATLAEVRDFMGLTAGTYNVYKGVYDVFGKYARDFYPKDVPEIPKFEDVVDTSYIRAALEGVNVGASTNQFTEPKTISKSVSTRSYLIEFDTGKATIKNSSLDQLFELANQSGMTGLRIRISGHTDNTGNPAINTALSRARAQAVADWLTAQAPATFPASRLEVRGYGDSTPVADNATEAGRSKNRRVEIVLGN